MNSGTKIVLSLITLFVGILVVYYGFVMPAGEMPRESTLPLDVATDPVQAEPAKPLPAPPPELVMGEPTSLARPERSPAAVPAPVSARIPPSRTALAPAPGRRPLAAATGRIENAPRTTPPVDGALKQGSPPPATARPKPAVKPPAAPVPRPLYTSYTVESGDSMSSIAQDWFGDDRKWHLISKANPLVDPNQLRIGQVLRLPPRDAPRDPVPSVGTDHAVTYRVRSGDTLSGIAEEHYGKAELWKEIYAANRAKIGSDPGALTVGMELVLPKAP